MSISVPKAAAALALASGFAASFEAHAQEFSFKPRARIQADLQHRDWRVRDEDDSDLYIRRFYLGGEGRIAGDWHYRLDVVFTPGSETIGVDDAYIEYEQERWSLFIGEHKITTPLDERTSSLDMPFVERASIIGAFGYGSRAGVGVLGHGDNWSAAAAIQGSSMNPATGEGDVDESRAVSARVAYAPILNAESGRLLHIGAHVRHRYQNDAPQRPAVRPLNGRDSRWIDAGGSIANRLDDDVALGGEFMFSHGPFALAAEYVVLEGQTPSGASRRFSARYVDAYWSLTGESRPYRVEQGAFGAVKPRAPLNEGGFGHWALSVRYDHADLSDGPDANRGEQTAYALGLDWIPVERVRLKLNAARSEMDRTVGADDEADIVTLRAQLSF